MQTDTAQGGPVLSDTRQNIVRQPLNFFRFSIPHHKTTRNAIDCAASSLNYPSSKIKPGEPFLALRLSRTTTTSYHTAREKQKKKNRIICTWQRHLVPRLYRSLQRATSRKNIKKYSPAFLFLFFLLFYLSCPIDLGLSCA